ncbi:zf-HC2 domain-containing protein [Massilia endophytica]|uniref:zf-HC2 domain-containing protein n=1 Tax=Massilia endophytica TaxID=2899220 RepID=UPI001E4B43C3|nr:zf-HC2 domain-containing protein [Massilia endophytica]UGQ46915.1 zf-HC2 domain-containing protein [Massilia endophytica]
MNTQKSSREEAHLAVQALLPWHVAGTLSAAEQAQVRRHLEECAVCQEDAALQRLMMAAEPGPPPGLDMDRAMERMMARVDAAPAPVPQRSAAPSLIQRLRGLLGEGAWRNWALAAQFAVIAILGLGLMRPASESSYRALGSGAVAAPQLIVIFKPDARLADVQQLLQDAGARIVDGPTVTGAYLVDVDEKRAAPLLASLRADPAVTLAEPLGAGARP